jgi:fatty acid desaturase
MWARLLLTGHAAVVIGSLGAAAAGHPRFLMLPVLTTFGKGYGGWLFFLCNSAQHIGLKDNVADFRLCARTIVLNPVARFLYWNMNFHIEHHMYTQVPCYRLGALRRAIQHDLPAAPLGLLATWRQIATIQARQARDPCYQHHQVCPGDQVTS